MNADLPEMRKQQDQPTEQASAGPTTTSKAEERGDFQDASLPELFPSVHLGADGAEERGGDGRSDGGGDLALEFFRQDAERKGIPFEDYLKEYGILTNERGRSQTREREWSWEGLGLDNTDLERVPGAPAVLRGKNKTLRQGSDYYENTDD